MPFFTTDQIGHLDKSPTTSEFEQHLKHFGFSSPSITMLIKNTYSFTTLKEMSIEQKQTAINLIIELVYDIPKIDTVKSDYFHQYAQRIEVLGKRTDKNLTPIFSHSQTQALTKFFQQEVLPFYDIYQLIFDKNPQFSLTSQIYEPVPHICEPPIYEGTVVQPQSIDILKQFIGQRAPKQQKKDNKKK